MTPAMSQLSDHASIVRRAHQLFNEGRVDEVAACATDDVVMDAASLGQRFEGRAAFKVFLKTFVDAFPDIALEWESHRDTADGVVVQSRWRGTHKGPLRTPTGEIPPTGRAVEAMRLCEVFVVRDGKIASIANYQDTSSLLRQLGVAG